MIILARFVAAPTVVIRITLVRVSVGMVRDTVG